MLPEFSKKLSEVGLWPLLPTQIDVFQINVGKMCNQTCKHCHVDAGPQRKEIMTRETMQECLTALQALIDYRSKKLTGECRGFTKAEGLRRQPLVIDITGGAPEMNPNFRWLVVQLRAIQGANGQSHSANDLNIIVRCNLTIIVANSSYNDLPQFFAKHRLQIVSSLPYYEASSTDRQRGNGVFEKSIKALHMLNEVGYGKEGSALKLDLVYNPVGAFLPAPQAELERDFKNSLKQRHNIEFNQLYTITNMPISRFLEFLHASNNYDAYMEKLVNAFNPAAAQGVMCRNTISIGWDGLLYDCDFNQMLEMPITTADSKPLHIKNIAWPTLEKRRILVGQHCYGCTAGSGSSCGGQLT